MNYNSKCHDNLAMERCQMNGHVRDGLRLGL